MTPREALAAVPPAASSAAAFAASPENGARQIAYTYSEPLIHFEYLKDCMALAHERGLANVLVSNGCINPEKAGEILPLVDAANIDLKCFSETTYRKVLGGDLETVLNFIRAACRCGVCLELTTLVVPGLNDGDAELDRCAEFIAGLEIGPLRGGNAAAKAPVPWHLSAYHPSYRWDAPPTKGAALLRAAERARKILPCVYTGNIAGAENDTPCPHCGAVLVRRRDYRVDTRLLPPSETPARDWPPARLARPCRCAHCGAEVPVYW
jgi:pyruvate formate lyase activating enzyme